MDRIYIGEFLDGYRCTPLLPSSVFYASKEAQHLYLWSHFKDSPVFPLTDTGRSEIWQYARDLYSRKMEEQLGPDVLYPIDINAVCDTGKYYATIDFKNSASVALGSKQKESEEPFGFVLTNENSKKFDGCAEDSHEMKLRWDLLPLEAVEKIVEIYTHGAGKYGDNTWQGVDKERYYSAMMRHVSAWRKGEEIDPDSKLSHLAHAGWNILALIYFEIHKEK